MENLNEALILLVIGMCMVFIILFLVVGIGNLVIIFANRYLKEPVPAVKSGDTGKAIPSRKLAIITAVVDTITQGRGRVDSIERK